MSESVAYTIHVKERDDTGVDAGFQEGNTQVYGTESGVAIRSYTGLVKIYNAVGKQVKEVWANGNKDIALGKGIYIVILGGETFKVVVE